VNAALSIALAKEGAAHERVGLVEADWIDHVKPAAADVDRAGMRPS
jgi:hypothetical protein